MAETTQLLDARSLGQRLQLSKRQIFRLNASGQLPRPVKIGGSIRWKLSDISHWQELNCPDREHFETEARKEGAAI